jgi:hypothetical protein
VPCHWAITVSVSAAMKDRGARRHNARGTLHSESLRIATQQLRVSAPSRQNASSAALCASSQCHVVARGEELPTASDVHVHTRIIDARRLRLSASSSREKSLTSQRTCDASGSAWGIGKRRWSAAAGRLAVLEPWMQLRASLCVRLSSTTRMRGSPGLRVYLAE